MSAVCLWWGFVTAVCGALLFPAFIEGIKTGQDASSELQLSLLKIQWLDVNQPFGFGKILTKWGRRSLSLIFILFQTLDPDYPLVKSNICWQLSPPHFSQSTGCREKWSLSLKNEVSICTSIVENSNGYTDQVSNMNELSDKWSHFITAVWGTFFDTDAFSLYRKSSLNVINRFMELGKLYIMKPILLWANWCNQELSSYSISSTL